MRLSLISALALSLCLASPASGQLAPPNEAGVTFGHVHLNVSDLEMHRELWVEHFDGELIERGPLTVVKYPGMLVLLREEAPTAESESTVMDHLGFKVRDIEPYLERWREAGHEVQAEFTGAEGFANAYLLAPDGIRIELQEDPQQSEDVVGYHVHWFTPDYAEMRDWYVEMFGAEPYERGSIATTANVPGMNLSFSESDSERAHTQGTAIDHVGFEVEDLEAFAAELEAKGVELDSPVREIPSLGLEIAFFTDPSGVYVELTEGLDEY